MPSLDGRRLSARTGDGTAFCEALGKIAALVLTIRDEHSDLLLPETFARMQRSGAQGITVPDAGHAPALMDTPTIRAVREFLLAEQ